MADMKDAHIVEIPVDEEHEQRPQSALTTITAVQNHPLTEISRSPGHLLLLKLWQREEDLFGRRIAVKESRIDSIKAEIFQLCFFFLVFHGIVLTMLFTSSGGSTDHHACKKWWIPSLVSVCTSVVFVYVVQVKLFAYWKVWRQLQRERSDNRAFARCIQELRMKGESFDLSKEPLSGKRMKSSSVEIKWKPLTWCSQNLITICLVCFTGPSDYEGCRCSSTSAVFTGCGGMIQGGIGNLIRKKNLEVHTSDTTDIYKDIDWSTTDKMVGAPVAVGRGSFMTYSPSPSPSPSDLHAHHFSVLRASASALFVEQEKYLSELLAERNKFSPFMPVLTQTCRLLNQEILRVTTLLANASTLGRSGLDHASPLTSRGIFSYRVADANGWASQFHSEMSGKLNPASAQNWLSSHGSSSSLVVKTLKVDIPVDRYPNYNFVGRLLGPRGNSLKRVEAVTECRVLIRGRGSIKDPAREEMMRGKPGYEHLNEPLHILVEAELPIEIVDARLMQAHEILEDLLKPVDETQDLYKKQQLRELAMLNGTLREEDSLMSGSVSPFRSSLGMKRAKIRV